MIPFSVTGEPLKPISHIASFMGGEVPVWEIRDVVSHPRLAGNNERTRTFVGERSWAMGRWRSCADMEMSSSHRTSNVRCIAHSMRKSTLPQLALARSFARYCRAISKYLHGDCSRLCNLSIGFKLLVPKTPSIGFAIAGKSEHDCWMFAIAFLFVRVLCDCFKSRRRLEAEILVLRHHSTSCSSGRHVGYL